MGQNRPSCINKCGSKPAILSLVEPFSDAYVPREFNKEFPQLISDFRDTSCINLPYAELLMKCKEIKNDLKVSKSKVPLQKKKPGNNPKMISGSNFDVVESLLHGYELFCTQILQNLQKVWSNRFVIQKHSDFLQKQPVGVVTMKKRLNSYVSK